MSARSSHTATGSSRARTEMSIELTDAARGKVSVKWNHHVVAQLKVTWAPQGGTEDGVSLVHLAGQATGLQDLADQIYGMYRSQFEAFAPTVSGAPAMLTLGQVDMDVVNDVAQDPKGADTAFAQTQAQDVYNLVMQRGGVAPATPGGSPSSPSLIGRVGTQRDRSEPGSPTSTISGIASTHTAASGAQIDNAQLIDSLKEERDRLLKELLVEREAHQKTIFGKGIAEGALDGVQSELGVARDEQARLRAQVDKLTEENRGLAEQLAATGAQLAAAITTIEERDTTIAFLKSEIIVLKATERSLRGEIAEKDRELSEARIVLARKEEQLQALQATGRPEDAESINALERDVLTLIGHIKVLDTQKAQLTMDLGTAQEQLGDLRGELGRKDARIDELASELARKGEELSSQAAALESLRATIAAKDQQIARLLREGSPDQREQIRALAQEVAAVRAQLLAKDVELAHAAQLHAAEVRRLNQQIASETEAKEAALHENARLRGQLEELTNISEAKDHEISALRLEIVSVREALSVAEGRATRSEAEEARKEQVIRGLNRRLHDLGDQVARLQGENEGLSSRSSFLEGRLVAGDAHIQQLLAQLGILATTNSDQARFIQFLVGRQQAAEVHIAGLSQALGNAQARLDSAIQTIDGLEGSLEATTADKVRAVAEKEEVLAEVRDLRAALDVAREENGLLAQQIRGLHQELDGVRAALDAKEHENAQLRAINAEQAGRLKEFQKRLSANGRKIQSLTQKNRALELSKRELDSVIAQIPGVSSSGTGIDPSDAHEALKRLLQAQRSLENRIDALTTENQQLREEAQHAIADITGALGDEGALSGARDLESQINRLIVRLSEKDAELAEAQSRNEVLTRELVGARDEAEAARGEARKAATSAALLEVTLTALRDQIRLDLDETVPADRSGDVENLLRQLKAQWEKKEEELLKEIAKLNDRPTSELVSEQRHQIDLLSDEVQILRTANLALDDPDGGGGRIQQLEKALDDAHAAAERAEQRADEAETKLEAIGELVGKGEPLLVVQGLKRDLALAMDRLGILESQVKSLREEIRDLNLTKGDLTAALLELGVAFDDADGKPDVVAVAQEKRKVDGEEKARLLQALETANQRLENLRDLALKLRQESIDRAVEIEGADVTPEMAVRQLADALKEQKLLVVAKNEAIGRLTEALEAETSLKAEALKKVNKLEGELASQSGRLDALQEAQRSSQEAHRKTFAVGQEKERLAGVVQVQQKKINELNAELLRMQGSLRAAASRAGVNAAEEIPFDEVIRDFERTVPAAAELEALRAAQTKLDEAVAAQTQAQERITELEAILKGIQGEISKIRSLLPDVGELGEMTHLLARFRAAYAVLDKRAGELDAENKTLKADGTRGAEQLQESTEAITANNRQIRDLIQVLDPSRVLTPTAKTDDLLAILKELLDKQESKLNDLTLELEKTRGFEAEAREREGLANDELGRLKGMLGSLISKDAGRIDDESIAAIRAKIAGLEKETTLARQEADEARKALRQAEENARAENQAAAAANERLTARVQKLESELEKALSKGVIAEASLRNLARIVFGQLGIPLSESFDEMSLEDMAHALDESRRGIPAAIADLRIQLAAAQNQIVADGEANRKLAAEKKAITLEADRLRGRVQPLEVQADKAAALQERVAKLTSLLEIEARRIQPIVRPIFNVTLAVNAAVDFDDATLSRQMAAFRSLATRIAASPAPTEASPTDMAERVRSLIEALPKAIAAGSLEALMSRAVAEDIDVYEYLLELLIPLRGDKDDLMLNLMLVVANHKGDLSPRAKDLLRRYLNRHGAKTRVQQVLATLSKYSGYLDPSIMEIDEASDPTPVAILGGEKIQRVAESQIKRLDELLDDKSISMTDETRAGIKGLALKAIRTYLGQLGFVVSEKGIADLVVYVRNHNGDLPPALDKYLSAGEMSGKHFREVLSKLLYQYNACDSESRNRFFDIASTNQLSWLTKARSSDEASKVLLKFIACSTPRIAFTRLQASHWGKQVETLHRIKEPGVNLFPIHGEGGSGKTATVLHFLKFLQDINPTDTAPSIFVSPFSVTPDPTSNIKHVMLPAPVCMGEGEQEAFILDVGLMTKFEMENAHLVIDESHLIRPGMKVFLRNGSDLVEVHEGEYLSLTASPLSAGYDVEATIESAIGVIEDEIRTLKSLRNPRLEEAKNIETLVVAFREFVEGTYTTDTGMKKSVRTAIKEALPTASQRGAETILDHWEKANFRLLDSRYINLEEGLDALRRFIGGELVKGENNGILGNTTVRPTDKSLIRKLEYLALKVYDALPPKRQENAEGALKYRTHTTRLVGGRKVTVLLSQTEIEREQALDEAIEIQLAAQEKFAIQNGIQRSIKALESEKARLSESLEDHRVDARLLTYQRTQALRQRALLGMHVATAESMTLQSSECRELLQRTLSSRETRVQLILPGIRFKTEDMMTAFAITLCPDPGEKPRVLIYHDSIPSSPTFGKNCCLRISIEGSTPKLEKLELSQYEANLARTLEISPVIGEENFADERFPDQIVMLYDDTNKQGGDYGIFSQASGAVTESLPQTRIAQYVFLNISERSGAPSVASKMSSGDIYQVQCRRRGQSIDPPSTVFTPAFSEALTLEHLRELPIDLISEYIRTFARGQISEKKRLVLAALDVCLSKKPLKKEDFIALIESFQVRFEESEFSRIALIASLEKEQRQIESYLQTAEAVDRIGKEILEIGYLSETDPFAEIIRSIKASLAEPNTAAFESITAQLPRIQTILEAWREDLKPYSIEEQDVVRVSTKGRASSAAKAGSRGTPAGSGVLKPTGSRLGEKRTVTVLRPRNEGESLIYGKVMEALSRVRMIHEYSEQARSFIEEE